MEFYTDIKFYKQIDDVFFEIKKQKNKIIKITDTTIAKIYPQIIDENTLIINSGEKFKDINSVCKIIEFALEKDLTRHDTFVGIGGGVICDLTAFASSIYKRGAKLHLIPTTLLAMVDAAIGGKTGCDHAGSKNMIGTFFPSHVLHIASNFVQSLNEKEFLSGLAEVIKTALLYDKDLTELLEKNSEKVLLRDKETINIMIEKCVIAKCKIVKEDLHEKHIRKQLNLGHTFAHALESISGLGNLTHGEAVAWGIARACQLSFNLNMCNESYKKRTFSLLEKYGFETKTKHPQTALEITSEDFLTEMRKDKKNYNQKITVILQNDLCDTEILEVLDDDIKKVL
ncbi:MAG: 3-dehydroquinate synthase [Treponema sp.]|nr:3-dehydroquinate synthase [Treponema sp.]